MQNIEQLLNLGKRLLAQHDNPLLEAQILLAHVLDCDNIHLHAWTSKNISDEKVSEYQALLSRRQAQEPMAYVLGYKEFCSLKFKVTHDTLVPRWDTEMMVRLLLDRISDQAFLHVADVGTGAGNIAGTLAYNRPNWHITATDISPQALAIAKENAQNLKLKNIEFIQSNWLEALTHKQFDVIISNPPYIREYDLQLIYGNNLFEPHFSLSAGPTGLEGFQAIIVQGQRLLKNNGFFIFEHGFDQAESLRRLLNQADLQDIQTFRDLAGREKVTIGYKKAQQGQ